MLNSHTRRVLLATTGTLSCVPSVCNASLTGQTLRATWLFPDAATVFRSRTIVVNDEIELTFEEIGSYSSVIDVDATTVTVFSTNAFWQQTEFNGFIFEDMFDGVPEIVGFDLVSVSENFEFTDRIITGFDADSFWFNLSGIQSASGETESAVFRITFIPAPSTAVFPAVLMLSVRRRRSGATPARQCQR